jgi:hypothetical protein
VEKVTVLDGTADCAAPAAHRCAADPARLALTLGRNTRVAANAPGRTLRQAQRDRTECQPRPVPDPRSAERKISRTKPPPTPEPIRIRNQLNRAKLEFPIDHHRSPAGSCMGGFPTPDGIRKNLHHGGRSQAGRQLPQADVDCPGDSHWSLIPLQGRTCCLRDQRVHF